MAKSANGPQVLRCAIYVRVSSERQDVENSLDRQLRACRAWAERNGHATPGDLLFIDEARSGATMIARPQFQRLLELLRRGGRPPFDAVLVDDDSRLDRGGRMAEIVEAFQARRVRLVSVDSGRDLTEESERLLVHVKSGLNEQYLHELARRTREGLISRVLHGYHAGGRTYGYRLTPEWPADVPPERRDRKNRLGTRVEVEPEQAAVVQRIFDLYARGSGQRSIAARLNEEGILSSRGKPSWDASAVRAMLLNSRYIGDWSWNKLQFRKVPESLLTEAERDRARRTGIHPRRSTPRPAEDLVRYENEALRIIPQELWLEVQRRFGERKRSPSGGRDSRRTRSPIAGILQCACGGGIFTTSSTRKGHTYTRLGCAWHRSRGPAVCENATSMRIEAVQEPILELVDKDLLAPENVLTALELYNQKVEDRNRIEKVAAQVKPLETLLTRLEREQRYLVDAIKKGVECELIAADLAENRRLLANARAERDDLLATRELAPIPRWTMADLVERLKRVRDDLMRLDPVQLREALLRLLGRVVVRPLGGLWTRGWQLEMKTRPLALLLPSVASLSGCGGRI